MTSAINIVPLTNDFYSGIKLFDRNGVFINFFELGKINYFLEKNIVKWIEEGVSVCIEKEAKVYGEKLTAYHQQEFKNRCVCCGSTEEIARHHVFPKSYFSQMKTKYIRAYEIHDVLPLCVGCHSKYEDAYTSFRNKMEKKYKYVKADAHNLELSRLHNENVKIMAARALVEQHESGCGENRHGKKVILPPDVLEAKKIFAKQSLHELKENPKPWSFFFVKEIEEKDELQEVIASWRKNFVDNLKPKFMPDFWSIDMSLS